MHLQWTVNRVEELLLISVTIGSLTFASSYMVLSWRSARSKGSNVSRFPIGLFVAIALGEVLAIAVLGGMIRGLW